MRRRFVAARVTLVCILLVLWHPMIGLGQPSPTGSPREPFDRTVALGSPDARYSLAAIRAAVAPRTVEVHCDPVFHRTLEFTGFPLQEVVAKFLVGNQEALVFTATDGYKVLLPRDKVTDEAVLAFTNTSDGSGWLPSESASAPADLGPLYLVWEGTEACDSAYDGYWPYQVESILTESADALLARIAPNPRDVSAAVSAGFIVFRDNCLSCHQVRGVGGTVGPALDRPMAVTDYWKEDRLRDFVLDAPSFIADTKMPPFRERLDSKAYDDLMAYIAWVATRRH
ncbi:MAG: c-type cytochrome [Gammaproteobacteria bacterium]